MKKVLISGILLLTLFAFVFQSGHEPTSIPGRRAADSTVPVSSVEVESAVPLTRTAVRTPFSVILQGNAEAFDSAGLVEHGWFRLARAALIQGNSSASNDALQKIAIATGDSRFFWQARLPHNRPFQHWQKQGPYAAEVAWKLLKGWPDNDLSSERQVFYLFECLFRPHEVELSVIVADFGRYFPGWCRLPSFAGVIASVCSSIRALQLLPYTLIPQADAHQSFMVAATLRNSGWPWPEMSGYVEVSPSMSQVAAQWWIEAGQPEKAMQLIEPGNSFFAARVLEDAALAACYKQVPAESGVRLQKWYEQARASFAQSLKEFAEAAAARPADPATALAFPDILAPTHWWLMLDSIMGENL